MHTSDNAVVLSCGLIDRLASESGKDWSKLISLYVCFYREAIRQHTNCPRISDDAVAKTLGCCLNSLQDRKSKLVKLGLISTVRRQSKAGQFSGCYVRMNCIHGQSVTPFSGVMATPRRLNVLSLFDGMGCGRIALDQAGVEVESYYASEIDKHAIAVMQANYPDTVHMGDVRHIHKTAMPTIDLLLGGSPCQGFSVAGKKENFQDPRSKLFADFAWALRDLKPKWFLFENVSMKKAWRDRISDELGVFPVKIDSADFTAQHRRRLYWTNIPIKPHNPLNIKVDMIKDAVVPKRYFLSPQVMEYLKPYGRRYRRSGKAPTLTTEIVSSGRDFSPKMIKELGEARRLTPTECERLQGVPEGYTAYASEHQRYRMLANGWTVPVIAHILSGLLTPI